MGENSIEEENRQSIGHLSNLCNGRGVPPSTVMNILLRGINRELYTGQDLKDAIRTYEDVQSTTFLERFETGEVINIENRAQQLASEQGHQLGILSLMPDYMIHINRGVQRGLFSQERVDRTLSTYLLESSQQN